MQERLLRDKVQTSRGLRLICKTVSESLRKEENRKEFEEWYLKEDGKPYVWKYQNSGRRI